MTRALYRGLVWMHPPAFRREFGVEMLWIYEEAECQEGVVRLFGDGLVSLARQWVLRTGWWRYALALLGATFQVTLGCALLFRIGALQASALPVAENPALAALVRLAAFTAIGLLAAVILLVTWWRKLSRRTEG